MKNGCRAGADSALGGWGRAGSRGYLRGGGGADGKAGRGGGMRAGPPHWQKVYGRAAAFSNRRAEGGPGRTRARSCWRSRRRRGSLIASSWQTVSLPLSGRAGAAGAGIALAGAGRQGPVSELTGKGLSPSSGFCHLLLASGLVPYSTHLQSCSSQLLGPS